MAARVAEIVRGTKIGETQFGAEIRNLKQLYFEVPATADAADLVTIPIKNYGVVKPIGVQGWRHVVADDEIVRQNPTTTANTALTEMTFTIPTSPNDKKRGFVLYYI